VGQEGARGSALYIVLESHVQLPPTAFLTKYCGTSSCEPVYQIA
ncbi:6176_t:CDS:1, partial [Gigaspora rosea]